MGVSKIPNWKLRQRKGKELKSYIEEVFTDYNDINEDTRVQLELINRTFAELQAQKRLADSPRDLSASQNPNNKLYNQYN